MAQAAYPISEAAKRAGVSVHQVRIYVQLGLVAPCKTTNGGHGQYDQACVERLRLIHAAVQSGLLLGELKDFFQALDKGNCRALQQQQTTLIARLAARRRAVQTCKALLSRLANRVPAGWPA
ncbi:MAG: MerR family transcriptional regulator [Gammaproteobacteria bacterium]|nr:MerR family transcriptional regulator [Gammaproteobacteria bacterium]MDE2023399.1 MerR family transcriptional regulator [Gammaproteobacteria bacterium]MDE2274535.1 MerR family transcriptional regulator [Gammaproteobacteria bacterium]